MNQKELSRLVKFARKHGVLRVKTLDIEIELHPASLFPETKKKSVAGPDKPIETKEYSEMDTLMWSVGGISDANESVNQ